MPQYQAETLAVKNQVKSLIDKLSLLTDTLEREHAWARVWELEKPRDDKPAVRHCMEQDQPSLLAEAHVRHCMSTESAEAPAEKGEAAATPEIAVRNVRTIWRGDAPEPDREPIPIVRVLQDGKAREAACWLYQRISRHPDQPPDKTDRMAGVIYAPHWKVAKYVKQVNEAKADLKKAVGRLPRSITNRSLRHELLKEYLGPDELPHLVQAYRQILHIDYPVERFSFGWARNMRTVHPMRVSDVLDYLASFNQIDDEGQADRNLRMLNQQQGLEVIARVEPVPPCPIVNFSGVVDGKNKPLRRTASLPLIITATLPNGAPDLRPLTDYLPDEKPERVVELSRRRRIEDKPLFTFHDTNIAFYCYLMGMAPDVASLKRSPRYRKGT